MNIWSAEIKELNQIYQTVKGKHSKLEKELQSLIKTDDANILLVYSRRCLEVIITDLCEIELKRHRGTEPLQRIIDKLNKEEIVPHNIIVSMQNVNSMSTFGAHPKDFELKQIKPVLLNLTSVLEWYKKYLGSKKLVIGESKVSGEKESISVKKEKLKAGKWIIIVAGVLLVAAVIISALNLLNHKTKVDSIVVLPFLNYTEQDIPEYWIDGMQALLIGDLQKIGNLVTIGATTSRTFKNSDKTIPQITSELNVKAALETVILSLGDYISLRVKLILPEKNERTIWQENFKEDINLIQNLNNEITRKIAEEIKIKLTPEQKRSLSKSKTVDRKVLEEYLKGYSYLNDLRCDSLSKAREYLTSAIEKDPDWAPSYVALGYVWIWLKSVACEPPQIADSIAFENFNKALELGMDLAETHWAMGTMAYQEWNWEKAEEEYQKALSINPNHALSHFHYSLLLYGLQRTEEANIQADLGYTMDPLNPYIQSFYAHTLLDRRDFISAQSFLEYLVSKYPDRIINYSLLENAAYYNGDLETSFEAGIIFVQGMMVLDTNDVNEIKEIFYDKGIMLHILKLCEG